MKVNDVSCTVGRMTTVISQWCIAKSIFGLQSILYKVLSLCLALLKDETFVGKVVAVDIEKICEGISSIWKMCYFKRASTGVSAWIF